MSKHEIPQPATGDMNKDHQWTDRTKIPHVLMQYDKTTRKSTPVKKAAFSEGGVFERDDIYDLRVNPQYTRTVDLMRNGEPVASVTIRPMVTEKSMPSLDEIEKLLRAVPPLQLREGNRLYHQPDHHAMALAVIKRLRDGA